MILYVHPFFSIPDPGVKEHWIPDPQHWLLIRMSIDPYHSRSRIRMKVKSRIQILIKVKIQELWRLKMELWRAVDVPN